MDGRIQTSAVAETSPAKSRVKNIQVKCSVTPEEHAVIQQKMKQVHQKSISAYLRLCALCCLVLVVYDDAIKFLFTMLRRVSEEINAIAKTAHRTGEVPPSDMEPLFEHICYTWYAAGVIQYELVKQQKEVEERESNDFRFITFHPHHFPLKKKSIRIYSHISDSEYEYIRKNKLRTYPNISAYLRQMAIYGFTYDLSKVASYLPNMAFLGNSIDNNFNQILRVIGDEKEEQEKYHFNVAYNIPNIKNKVGDICRILRFMQFELR